MDCSATLIRDHSVSELIQCAGQQSKIGVDDDSQSSFDALGALVSASKKFPNCKLGGVFSQFQGQQQNVDLVKYMCGKASDADMCCLSERLGTKKPEHSLKGICKGDDNLLDNPGLNCGGNGAAAGGGSGGGGGEGGEGGEGSDDSDNGDDGQDSPSSSTPVDNSSESTAPSSAPSSIGSQTTSPTETASPSPAVSPSSSASPNVGATGIVALGWLLLVASAGVAL
ncbi:hypothetical protein ACLMJK_006343 [Lecanora helva]